MLLPVVAYADTCSTSDGKEWIKCILNNFINVVAWPVFIAVVVVMFMWTGLLFLLAKGDVAKLGEARKALIWALFGVALGVLAFSIIKTLQALLGL